MRQILPFHNQVVLAGTATAYISLVSGMVSGTAVTAANVSWVVDGELVYLRIEIDDAPGTGKSWTFTVQIAEVDTAAVIVIADSDVSGEWTGTLAVADGDLVRIECVPSGSPPNTFPRYVTAEFEHTADDESGYAMSGLVFNQPIYLGLFGGGQVEGATDDEGDAPNIAPMDGTVVADRIYVGTGLFAGDVTAVIYKNGIAQDGTGGTVDTAYTVSSTGAAGIAGSKTFTLPFVAGDELVRKVSMSGFGGNRLVSCACRVVAAVPGESIMSLRLEDVNDARYFYFLSGLPASPASTPIVVSKAGVTPFQLSRLRYRSTAASGSGVTRTLVVHIAGVDSALSDAIAGTSDVDGANASDTAAVLAGETIALRQTVSGGSAAAADTFVSMVQSEYVAPPVPPIFELDDALSGIVGPLFWTKIVHKDASGDPAVFPWAPVTIADPDDYYDGLKEAKLLSIGEISCPLSDRSGRLQVPTCDVTYSDLPGADGLMTLRGMLGRDTQRVLKNAEITVFAITDEARRALLDPEIVFRGYIDRYGGPSDYQFTIHAKGWIAKRLKAPLWSETVRDVFPGAPVTARDIPLPIALGSLSDQGSATPAPVAVLDETARGGSVSPDWISSYGDIATPPTGLALSEDAAAGNLEASTYYGMVTRVVAGVESDPEPFLPDGEPITVGANAAIEMVCDDDGADTYRFYLGHEVAGGGEVLFSQYIETADPTTPVVFTDHAALSTGAITATNLFGAAAVLAVMADGRTVLSAVAFVRTAGYLRPVRIAWTPVASAVSYEVYLRFSPTVSDQPYERVFAVPTSQVNTNSDVYWEWLWGDDGAYDLVDGAPEPEGVIAPVYVGLFTDNEGFADWKGFLVSARPCTDGTLVPYFDGVPVDAGNFVTTWAIPGEGSWSTWFGPDLYYEVDGYRLWMMFVRGPDGDAIADGTSTLRVNVDGLEDEGDGTGATITSIYEQLRVIAQNCLLADTPDLTGTFDVVPTFSDSTPRLDLTSLAQATTDGAAVIAGGPAASRWLPGSLTGDQFFQDWCPSAFAKVGIKPNGQMVVAVHNPAATPVAVLDEATEILRNSYSFEATDQGFGNVLPYAYEARYDSPTSFSLEVSGEAEAAGSITDHDERVPDTAIALTWRRASATAGQIAAASLVQSAYLPQVAQAASVLHWVYRTPGDVVSVTHREGPSESGYVARSHAVLGMSISLTRMTVGLTLLDLDPGGA
jgi:hypothetical protein